MSEKEKPKFQLSINKKQDLRVFFFVPAPPVPLKIIPIISHDLESAANFAKRENKMSLMHVEPTVFVQDLLDMIVTKKIPKTVKFKKEKPIIKKPEDVLINMTKMFRDDLIKTKKDKESLTNIIGKVERRLKKLKK